MSPAPLTRRARLSGTRLTVVLGALSTFGPLASDMYLPSFPDIAAHFDTELTLVQISLSIFFFGMAAGQLLYGPLLDRFGRRPPMIAGLLLFSVSSLLLIFVPTIESFIALRLIQAIGGCAGVISARAIVRDLYDEQGSARILSLMLSIQVIAPAIAPGLGHLIAEVASWEWIFVALALFGAACAATAYFALPETLPPESRRSIRVRELGAIHVQLARTPLFIIPGLTSSFILAGLFAYIAASPFVFMTVFGTSPELFSALFALVAFGMVIVSQLNHMLLKRYSARQILSVAVAVNVAVSLMLMAVSRTTSLPIFMVPLFLTVGTRPIVGRPSRATAMAATGRYAGTGSSFLGFMQLGLGSVLSYFIGYFHGDGAVPLCLAILLANFAGAALYFSFWKTIHPPQPRAN